LTVTDHASRFLLTCEALSSTREDYAFTVFERLFKERGLPANIRSDNGVPFASAHALFNLSKRKELGGTCDQNLSANSWDEMVQKMTKHVRDKHPDVAKDMEKMHNEDPKKWGREMKPKFDAVPEHRSATN
jgi:predicted small metal-binding protein